MGDKLIHINNLQKKYGQREVVSDVSMVLNKGEIIEVKILNNNENFLKAIV